MKTPSKTVDSYLSQVPAERQEAFTELRDTIKANIPLGFDETMNYGMIGWVIPHSIYPAGYHCDPKLPLPFVSIASQKNFIALYHMGLYANEKLLHWFTKEFPKHSERKLDMGKSCIRFKNPDHIPFKLIAKLIGKMSADEWIKLYESHVKR